MWEIHKSGSERGVKLFYMAEYCDTLQSKEKRNCEHKACLNDRALRLLDQEVTWKSGCFPAPERGDFSKNSGFLQLVQRDHFISALSLFNIICLWQLCSTLIGFLVVNFNQKVPNIYPTTQ